MVLRNVWRGIRRRSTSSGQATFEIKKVNVNNGNVKMMLLPIGHKMLKNVMGRFSLFIDGSSQCLAWDKKKKEPIIKI